MNNFPRAHLFLLFVFSAATIVAMEKGDTYEATGIYASSTNSPQSLFTMSKSNSKVFSLFELSLKKALSVLGTAETPKVEKIANIKSPSKTEVLYLIKPKEITNSNFASQSSTLIELLHLYFMDPVVKEIEKCLNDQQREKHLVQNCFRRDPSCPFNCLIHKQSSPIMTQILRPLFLRLLPHSGRIEGTFFSNNSCSICEAGLEHFCPENLIRYYQKLLTQSKSIKIKNSSDRTSLNDLKNLPRDQQLKEVLKFAPKPQEEWSLNNKALWYSGNFEKNQITSAIKTAITQNFLEKLQNDAPITYYGDQTSYCRTLNLPNFLTYYSSPSNRSLPKPTASADLRDAEAFLCMGTKMTYDQACNFVQFMYDNKEHAKPSLYPYIISSVINSDFDANSNKGPNNFPKLLRACQDPSITKSVLNRIKIFDELRRAQRLVPAEFPVTLVNAIMDLPITREELQPYLMLLAEKIMVAMHFYKCKRSFLLSEIFAQATGFRYQMLIKEIKKRAIESHFYPFPDYWAFIYLKPCDNWDKENYNILKNENPFEKTTLLICAALGLRGLFFESEKITINPLLPEKQKQQKEHAYRKQLCLQDSSLKKTDIQSYLADVISYLNALSPVARKILSGKIGRWYKEISGNVPKSLSGNADYFPFVAEYKVRPEWNNNSDELLYALGVAGWVLDIHSIVCNTNSNLYNQHVLSCCSKKTLQTLIALNDKFKECDEDRYWHPSLSQCATEISNAATKILKARKDDAENIPLIELSPIETKETDNLKDEGCPANQQLNSEVKKVVLVGFFSGIIKWIKNWL